MSAIAGIYHLNKDPIISEQGQGLMQALQKYPADDIGVFQKDYVFFGCHSQWITPESINEQLPSYQSDRCLAITADAIIDNREELFERLEVKRPYREGMPDSELILLAYEKWGKDCPKYLVGDFAFMIWDERKQLLFGARDPSGYRTLYYHQSSYRFAFCTTIEPLLTLPYLEKQVNEEWLAEYLAITGLIDTVGASMTPYLGINQIPPFHTLTLSKDQVKLTKYGTFYTNEQINLKSNEEYIEAFQEVFQEAVNCRLRTHRNVGSHLSGGLDSGAVVGFAAKEMKKSNKILHTFSYIPPSDFVDFTSKRLMPDERPFIKKTVEYVGGISDHYFNFDGKSSYSEINEILEVNEMPYKFIENSFWLKGMFEKANEYDIGILLNGDIGNLTVSWGSALDYYAILLKKLKWVRLYKELNQYSQNTGGARLRNLPVIARKAFPIIDKLNKKSKKYKFPLFINQEFARRTGVFKKLKEHGIDQSGWLASPNMNEQRRTTFENMFPWNSGNTLYSKLSLQHLMWKRDPTNDLRVVRYCLSVPDEQCVMNGMDRALIRRSTEHVLPDEIRLNQRIRGIQGADWVHRVVPEWDAFISEVMQLSEDKRLLEYIDGNIIKEALKKGAAGPRREKISDPEYKVLTRSLILYRFLKKFF